ncbi:MAG: hypothetical protein CEO21_149 [Microgenomates group bacterium Gr01-1014_80]|nr:MAG: hypothetical protein CEO21_149 [Microgenomates group bacterium Gr01-1014_80]
MIGFLSGTVRSKEASGQIIVLVAGVGYEVSVPGRYTDTLKESEALELFIYTHVREDILNLYGFLSRDELTLFKLVLSVSGVGPKTALSIIDRGAESVEQAIIDADTDFFTAIPRLGRRNAQKIIIELKNKLGGLKDLNLGESRESAQAIEALRAMGYTNKEALEAIRTVPAEEQTIEQKITFALRRLGSVESQIK